MGRDRAAREALQSHTYWGAFAAFAEHELGTIRAGKRADFVVLSTDVTSGEPEAMAQCRVLMTAVDGHVAFRSTQPE